MSIEVTGLDATIARLGHISTPELRHDLAEAIAHAIPPSTVATMRGRASRFGAMQSKASGGIGYRKLADGVQLSGGGTLFAGAEFGGRRRRPLSYVTQRRNSVPYIVRRRTTMQFLPHLGQTGYFFWPTVRQELVGIDTKLSKALLELVGG